MYISTAIWFSITCICTYICNLLVNFTAFSCLSLQRVCVLRSARSSATTCAQFFCFFFFCNAIQTYIHMYLHVALFYLLFNPLHSTLIHHEQLRSTIIAVFRLSFIIIVFFQIQFFCLGFLSLFTILQSNLYTYVNVFQFAAAIR